MKKEVLPVNRERAERLAELGTRLRDLRQQQEISLEEVAGKTRIQARLLRAIEQGKLDQLPEPVYVHGFLRQYADAIGLNGTQFASEFPTQDYRSQPTLRPSWRSLPGAQLRPMHLYLLYMLLIVGAVNGLSYVLNRSVQSPIATLELQQPAAPMGPAPAKPSARKAIPNKVAVAADQKPVRVGVKLTSESWMQVLVDGKSDFEGVLPQGTQRVWSADKQVVLRAGNAGGVVVSFNDGQAKALGQPGAIEEVAFPPDPRMANLSTAPVISP